MDKKNLYLGTIFIIAAGICYYISYRYGPARPSPSYPPPVAPAEAGAPNPTGAAAGLPNAASEPAFAAVSRDSAGASVVTLHNRHIEVHFTDFGGAIRDVELVDTNPDGSEKYPDRIDTPDQPFAFNRDHKDPLFAFVNQAGLDKRTRFRVVRQTASEVDYQTVLDQRLRVTRRYIVPAEDDAASDPYQIRTETVLENIGAAPFQPANLLVALGTAAPVSQDDRGYQLTTGYYRAGDFSTTLRARLEPSSGFFGSGLFAHPATAEVTSPGPIEWASVSNQFFASIVTPDTAAGALITRRVKLQENLPDTDAGAYGITADLLLDVAPVPAHGVEKLGALLYVGPKEYHRLANPEIFKENQDRVMNWGYFKVFSASLLWLMILTHKWVSNWGVAIILTTLLLKVCFVPLTLASSRSAKRMQKLQPEMKLIREKFKDNPQKQQAATMELFKRHRVNPVGGCLPMLITIPFFWGFFRMLQSAAELRFAPFLWAHNLAGPDTIGHLGGIDINVLPLVLGLSMFLQMHFAPQPTVDSSQQKMMKFMPLLMIFFYYNYSCALSLYSTVNAFFSILQQSVINRMKDPEPPAAPAAPARPGGKPVKNVTPRRK